MLTRHQLTLRRRDLARPKGHGVMTPSRRGGGGQFVSSAVFMLLLCVLSRLLNYDKQTQQFKADERKLLQQNRAVPDPAQFFWGGASGERRNNTTAAEERTTDGVKPSYAWRCFAPSPLRLGAQTATQRRGARINTDLQAGMQPRPV
ncbi:uncharacterized protein V6R79_014222 [Siganus canaliculatus]